MKKIISFCLVGLFFLSAAACDKKQEDNSIYSKGVIKSNVYSSKYFNIKYTAPDEYELISWDAYQGAKSILIEDEKGLTGEAVCYASGKNDTYAHFDICSLNMSELLITTEEQYFPGIKYKLEASGFAVSYGESREIAGESFKSLKALKDGDISEYYYRTQGGQIIYILFYYGENDTASRDMLLSGFEKLK